MFGSEAIINSKTCFLEKLSEFIKEYLDLSFI
jgi:hypothetical protein